MSDSLLDMVLVQNNQHMEVNSKAKIYKTCGRPLLTDAKERRTKQKTNATEMKSLRAITCKTLTTT